MKKFKSLVLAVMGLLCCMSVSAEDFEVDGIYYNITSRADKTVAVTYRGRYYWSYSNEYSGEVKIPESVTYSGNTYSVTSIGDYAFRGCSLTSVEIPNSVTSIGERAFEGCSSLTSIVVAPNNPKYDSRDNCNAIIESESNTLIAGCMNTTIPNSVTSIGNSAFSGCTSLTSVVIPNSVTSIGNSAFYYCSSLTSVEILNSVTSIGNSAFSGCTSLTSVVIPNSVTSIGNSAFIGCSSLTSIVVAPNNPKYDSRDNCNAIIESESNTLIAGCLNTTIPNNVTSIGNYAFSGCDVLTFVEIPNSVTSIGIHAFSYCSSLTSVEIPNSVTSIGNRAFSGCSSLTSVEIPNSVTSIGSYAFSYCSSLTSVEIPNSVTSIEMGAFSGCSSLTSVELPNSVTSIGYEAFSYCSSLTSVEIPNSVTSIGESAFSGTAWYNNQPDGVIYVGKVLYTYKGTMPANTSITVEDGTVSISPRAFYNCSSLTSVEIGNSVTSIGKYAFQYCSSLTSVEIGNSVTSIGEGTFSYCSSLTSVVIPNSVKSIGISAFGFCENLKKLISYAEVPPVCGSYVFYGVNTQECTLQVPEKSISAYQQADQWKEFFLIEGVPTAIGGVTVDGAVPATADVYSTNGMLVKRNADLKNLKHELPAGIYIIGGKKVWVK